MKILLFNVQNTRGHLGKEDICAMEDYSSIKKKETMLLAAVCIQIEIVILSKINQKHRKTSTI